MGTVGLGECPRLLVIADKFKGTLSAAEVTQAVCAALREVDATARIDQLALADGGEGTLEAVADLLGGVRRCVVCTGPLGRPRRAGVLLVREGGQRIGVIEASQACGRGYDGPGRSGALRPLDAGTRGVGELLGEALSAGADRLWVGLGGSLSTDGGAGLLAGLGFGLLDGAGRVLPGGGGALIGLSRMVRPSGLRLRGDRVLVLADVALPLLGPRGSAAVFAPQKGATPGQVRLLEAGLERLVAVARRDLGVPEGMAMAPGSGASGGLGWALHAVLGCRIVSGADVLLGLPRARALLEGADVLISGEGRLDRPSLEGKLVGQVLKRAEGRPVVLVVGENVLSARECRRAGIEQVFSLTEAMGGDRVEAQQRAEEALARACRELGRWWVDRRIRGAMVRGRAGAVS